MNKNKGFTLWLILALLLGAVMLLSSQNVSASALTPPTPTPTSVPQRGVADGNWQWYSDGVTGSETAIDLVSAPKPLWSDVMSWNALTVSGATRICHPFRGGQMGWVADIRIFTGKSWEPISTTMEWVPDTEGTLMACAYAPSAATYALFGGYVKPAAAPMKECEFRMKVGYIPDDLIPKVMHAIVSIESGYVPPVGTTVRYSISQVTPSDALTGTFRASQKTTDTTGTIIFTASINYVVFYPTVTVDSRVIVGNCYKDFHYESSGPGS